MKKHQVENPIRDLEGFFQWASRNEITISFHPRRYLGEDVSVMKCTSHLRNYHFERAFPTHDFQMNAPFSRILFNDIMEFERKVYEEYIKEGV